MNCVRTEDLCYSQIIPGARRNAGWNEWKGNAAVIRWHRQPGGRIYDLKTWCELEATYFHAPPYTSERAKQKVVDLAKKLTPKYSGPINLHVVNFTDIQLYIYDQCPHDELTIIMRRYMMRIAEHFAKEDGCLALDHRREYRTGGKPDHAESCSDE